MATTLKIGDVVRLKSGGPQMTVDQLGTREGQEIVRCVWFEGTSKKTGTFPPVTLESAAARGGVSQALA
jgi:uncharacterized protein YodC (DUF2158 family)